MNNITLNQCETGEVDFPDTISSGGLFPCIAIGIYDSYLRKGYMIHESNAHVNENVPVFLSDVLAKSNVNDLLVYVAGGGIDPNEPDIEINEYTQECRDYVQQELENRFPKNQIVYDWNNTEDTIELFLYADKGEFYAERTKVGM